MLDNSLHNMKIRPTTNYHGASGTVSTLVESALQIHPFLTNKANFRKSQMNVSTVITMNYEQRTMNDELKNKPNTNPIQSQYKANTNPIQTQYKANSNPTCRGVASGEAGTNPILHSPRPNPSRKYVAGFLRVFYAVLTVFGSPDKE